MTTKTDEKTICQNIKKKGTDSFSSDLELDKKTTASTNSNLSDEDIDDFEMTDWRW